MKSLFRSAHSSIFLLLFIALIIGSLIVKDFGQSWDEVQIYLYESYAINAYQFFFTPQNLPDFLTDLDLYGPAYFLMVAFLSRIILALHSSWSIVTAHHFIYFGTYLLCSLLLYFLSIRWMSRWAAFGAVLLFISQPLLWGHAFINPKDIPFLTFFLASILSGFQMMDADSDSKWNRTLLAGIVLGLTVSVRVIGPLAGLLVAGYGLMKSPRKAAGLLSFYILVAGITTYLTWPYLWKAPITNFLNSLNAMSNFPEVGPVLFKGALYSSDRLPLTYFPTFLALQLTEPALVLIPIGATISLWLFIKGINREPALLLVGWFLAPAVWIVLSRSPLYDNARQLLFLWTPLFVLSGIAMDRLMVILKTPLLKSIFLAGMSLPGIFACIHLHPYEYIYYNKLIGGVHGAYRRFDLDYWGTSLKEATEFVNRKAKKGDQVVVIGPILLVKQYARSDLKVVGPHKLQKEGVRYYFGIYSTRNNTDERRCHNAKTVLSIERDGGVLSYVKKARPGDKCW